ncbi:MAG TPA: AMP-binding protein [Egibacteraceae bacterium]|nr:AMP-binding protein [Egibacteraceae bacterium]
MSRGKKLLALALPPGQAFVEAWRRAWDEGHAVLPVDPRLPAAQLRRLLDRLRPHELTDASGTRVLGGGAPLDPRTDLVVATSGSTGARKGAELSRAAVEWSAAASLARLDAAGEPWLCCLPLDHLAGLQVVVRARLSGAPLLLHERFDVGRVAAEGPGAFVSLVPTMLTRLLDAGADVAAFRGILLGGAAADPALLRRAREAGARVVTTYGMTETAGGCVYDGVPLDGVDARVGQDGRIGLRGPMLFHVYRLAPGLSAAALAGGWFTTADRGAWRDGRLVVLGRADDVVVTGGHNVSLDEVADLVATHPAVAEAAAFALPDSEWGALVAVAVVPREPAAPPTLAQVRAHVRARAAAHAAPKRLLIVTALPRGALGKVDREALRALAASDDAAR